MLADREIEVLKTGLTAQRCAAMPGTVRVADPEHTLVATADEWLRLRRFRTAFNKPGLGTSYAENLQ
jgi:hypothetical protein